MAEITNQFARFILECKETYEELCERIERGEVRSGVCAKLTIEVPASTIDEIRKERLAIAAARNGNGDG